MDSNKCCTYQIATGRITAIISWLGHRFKDTRRHRQERVQTGAQTRLSVQKGFFFTDRFKFCLSAKETFTVVLVIFDRRGNTWKCRFVHCQVSNSGALKRGNVKDTYHPRIDGLPVWGREVSRCRGRDRASAARNLSISGFRSKVGSPDCLELMDSRSFDI